MKDDRRSFLKQVLLGSVTLATSQLGYSKKHIYASQEALYNKEKLINLALIGAGGMGTADTNSALSTGKANLIAVCDLYDARINKAKEAWGETLVTTKNYKDILALSNLDAVIIGTPDHWHQKIAIEALGLGKHVYCEKPVIHSIGEGTALINAEQSSKKIVFQTGSQGMSSVGNEIARLLVQDGTIGKINNIQAEFSAAPGNPKHYLAPDDASEKTIWWEQFLGSTPKIAFDPQRFFHWRNWREYGTTIAGDLFVHVISSVHYIMNTNGPNKVYTTGGLSHYVGGYQNVPDIMLAYVDYPEKNGLGEFTLSLGANYVDGVSKKWGSTNFRIIGEKGSMDVLWDKVIVKTVHKTDTKHFDSLQAINHQVDIPEKISDNEYIVQANSADKGGHYNHFEKFFRSINEKKKSVANALFGVQTASVALLCYESYIKEEVIHWNPDELKII